jgi:Zn finger protein HypA/HybF involved in hydrogenase expression
MTKEKMTPCCPSCKSHNLSLDAGAIWDQEKQEFEFELISVYCNDCHEIGDFELTPTQPNPNQ